MLSKKAIRLLIAFVPVTPERTGQRKLAQLMSNHFFGDIHADEDFTIVNHERMPDEFRRNRRPASPRLDRFFLASLHGSCLRDQLRVDIRPLLKTSPHGDSPRASRPLQKRLNGIQYYSET
jgi:hypothetical protein